MKKGKKDIKVKMSEAQAGTIAYAIQYYLEAVEGEEGVGNEVRSCKSFLKKIQ